ncbi:MAG: spermidine/putrescine ABC transporter permease PotB [Marinobacter sp.]
MLAWGWLLFLVLAPNLLVVGASVMTRDPGTFISLPLNLGAYRQLFDPLYLKVFLHSLYMAAMTALVCLLIGYPFAWALSKLGKQRQLLLIFLLIVPFWTNSLVRTYALKMLLASHDLGAGRFATFIHVIVPLTLPGVLAGVMLVLLPAMGLFFVPDILGGSRNLLVGNVIKNHFLDARNWPFGAAASIVLTVTMAILMLAHRLSKQGIGEEGTG